MANRSGLRVVEGGLYAPRKLSIACGQNKPKGFVGIDLAGDADIVHDLFEFPWPIKEDSVQEVECSHFVEHIPHRHPGWDRDGWWMFFDELYRVMKKDATGTFIHPYSRNDRADWDPTHERRVHEMTWQYLDPGFRKANGLDHYPVSCDFEIVSITQMGLSDDYMARNDQMRMHMMSYYFNVIADLGVVLRCRK